VGVGEPPKISSFFTPFGGGGGGGSRHLSSGFFPSPTQPFFFTKLCGSVPGKQTRSCGSQQLDPGGGGLPGWWAVFLGPIYWLSYGCLVPPFLFLFCSFFLKYPHPQKTGLQPHHHGVEPVGGWGFFRGLPLVFSSFCG